MHDSTRLDDIELFPFKEAIAAGLGGVMVAHLYIPAYDTTAHRAASLSPSVVTHLLQEQLGFKGITFTDALNMKAVSRYYQPGELDLLALKAGNDVLLFSEDVPKAIACIQQAMHTGNLDKGLVESKVKKILRTKYQLQLAQWKPLETRHLQEQLNRPQAHLLKQQLFEQAITLVANQDNLIPLENLHQQRFASLDIIYQPDNQSASKDKGMVSGAPSLFSQYLAKYASITHYTLNQADYKPETLDALAGKLKEYNVVIVGIQAIEGNRANHFGLKKEVITFLQGLQAPNTQVIVVLFGNVYSLSLFQGFNHLIAAYEADSVAEQVVPQIIFGALPAKGRLPVSIPGAWSVSWGIQTAPLKRLGYSYPEAVDMDSEVLQTIDQVVEKAIQEAAMPGCQVLVARKGKVVLEKAYGYHTYEKKNRLAKRPSMI